jgi:hypothetical protein
MRSTNVLILAAAIGLGSACAGEVEDFDESRPLTQEDKNARVTEAFDVLYGEAPLAEMTAIGFGGFEIDEEPIYANERECSMYFFGTNFPEADQYAIWNLGLGGIADESYTDYPSDDRPDLYAVLAPAPADRTHHVDGFDQFDHYHIADRSSFARRSRFNGKWDVYFVFPGPNFDAGTYEVATDVESMQQQVADGILGAPLLTTEAGFDPLVIRTPVLCWR